uniref:Putative ovule protein n=1 Tax=Solanum chacoense TaxID=4108 RepID=A0A0V0HNM7_SOLCH
MYFCVFFDMKSIFFFLVPNDYSFDVLLICNYVCLCISMLSRFFWCSLNFQLCYFKKKQKHVFKRNKYLIFLARDIV